MYRKYWLTASKRGLSLSRKSVVRLTNRPDMTLDVYRGRKTTTQQQQQPLGQEGQLSVTVKVCTGSTGSKGGLSLSRKSVFRLIDCPDITKAVYRWRDTTTKQQCSTVYGHVNNRLATASSNITFFTSFILGQYNFIR